MFRRPTQEERFGCLFAMLGGLSGILIGGYSFSLHVAAIQRTSPNAVVCGLPAVAGMFGGLIVGTLGGALFGMILGYFLPRHEPDEPDV